MRSSRPISLPLIAGMVVAMASTALAQQQGAPMVPPQMQAPPAPTAVPAAPQPAMPSTPPNWTPPHMMGQAPHMMGQGPAGMGPGMMGMGPGGRWMHGQGMQQQTMPQDPMWQQHQQMQRQMHEQMRKEQEAAEADQRAWMERAMDRRRGMRGYGHRMGRYMIGGCPSWMGMMPGEEAMPPFVEGRIAFLRAELGITDAQGQAFDNLAKAIRDNMSSMQAMREAMHGAMEASSPLERLDRHLAAMEGRLKSMQQVRPALAALYGALSDEQRQRADMLLPGMGCVM